MGPRPGEWSPWGGRPPLNPPAKSPPPPSILCVRIPSREHTATLCAPPHPCLPQLPVLLYLPPTSAALLLHLWWFSKWLKCGGSKKGAGDGAKRRAE